MASLSKWTSMPSSVTLNWKATAWWASAMTRAEYNECDKKKENLLLLLVLFLELISNGQAETLF